MIILFNFGPIFLPNFFQNCFGTIKLLASFENFLQGVEIIDEYFDSLLLEMMFDLLQFAMLVLILMQTQA